eukprot:SAG31_NODE_877_length_11303_cov_18.744556_2_plen_195_part_00
MSSVTTVPEVEPDQTSDVDSGDEGFDTAEEEAPAADEPAANDTVPAGTSECAGYIGKKQLRSAHPTLDSRTGLVLTHFAESMPPSRKAWKAPLKIMYDQDTVGKAARLRCTHENCRNNPNCSAPYDRDCSPNTTVRSATFSFLWDFSRNAGLIEKVSPRRIACPRVARRRCCCTAAARRARARCLRRCCTKVWR